METVTINGTDYLSYASVAQADEYLNASIYATDWQDETDDDVKGRALVSATRWIDSIAWKGEKADPDQLNEWPRTGIDDVEPYVAPNAIVNATIELANLLYTTPDLQATLSDVSAKRLKAGSVEIEYFRGTTVQTITPFPTQIMNMIRQYLASQGSLLGGAVTYGTDHCSPRARTYGFTHPF